MKKYFGIKTRKEVAGGEVYGFPRVKVIGSLNSLDYVLYLDTGRGAVYNLFEKNKKF